MCGIFGVTNDASNMAAQTVLEGLKKLEYRGYDSWGVALQDEPHKSVLVEKHIGKIGTAHTTLPKGKVAIGHTRWATHGGVTDVNAHPHLDCTSRISVIHNGIVENFQELKTILKQQGHVFISETDTEVIAHLIEERVKTEPLLQATLHSFKELIGSNAIAVLDGQTGEIIVCRNGSPLVIGFTKTSIYLASDATALLQKTNSVHFMDDGEAVSITGTQVHLYAIGTEKEKKLSPQTIDWKAEETEKGGYHHYVLKEIHDQVHTIPQALMRVDGDITSVVDKLRAGYKPVFVACGSASYCGLAAQYIFAKHNIDAVNLGAYEFMPFAPLITDKSIVFAISQSGETADTLIAVREAKKRGACIVAVVNAQGTTLERLADYCIPVGAGPEIAVVSTKAFTAQVALFIAIGNAVSKATLAPFESVFESWLADPTLEEQILAQVKRLVEEEHVYVIGKHINYPAALEFALKLKESSYMHAEAFAAGELKHGVISLIQPGTPCIVLSTNDEVKGEVLSSAIELKSRGGYIIGVSPEPNTAFDAWIKTPSSPFPYSLLYNVTVGQLFGYYLGVGRGADPDKPRNLAKSVTVK